MIHSFLQNGDSAVTVQFKNEISKEVNSYVTSLCAEIENNKIKGVIEYIPTFCSVSVLYDCTLISAKKLISKLEKIIKNIKITSSRKAKLYEIPVCYDDCFALDMGNVCEHSHLTREEIIARHSGRDYLIYMLGFLPGFAYLGGMDEALATPRLDSPRSEIFEGAVGIGGEQTGIYPVASPGGWQLIGKTPVKVYDKERENPILYSSGDYIRFVPVSLAEYDQIETQINTGTYRVKVTEVER
ncbi:5-oxoprolinase subunit PxpB [uncultured Eubacterium sp.]|uniref:5-oxoprolinase subunit PxpB n=1 Tax=uncultured Eubacterium sp. TaxID=165185 RepID=UPI0025E512EF|nr:5-oxoprolinase subunit PxpB [uncultured Eubacterium sp.]